jgi:DNA-binding transcriptional LysR family regulator
VTLEDLRVLTTVAEHQNMTTAARMLGRSQAAVAQHIRRLEAELGAALLVPGRRGSSLTPAGERFALAASAALSALARGARAVHELASPSGPLRIATGGTTISHILGTAIAEFRTRWPAVGVEVHSAGSTKRCLDAVRQDLADLAFVTITHNLTGIDACAVIETGWSVVSPIETCDQQPGRITMSQLPSGPYISLHPSSASAQELNRQLGAAGITLTAADTLVDNWDTAASLVELRLGHALVPDIHAVHLQSARRVARTEISDLAPVRFGWATPDHRLLPAAASAFASLLPATLHAAGRTRVLDVSWSRNRPEPGLP